MSSVTLAPRPSFWRFIVDRNPFCLLSAVSMFAGCRVIISAMGTSPGDLKKLITLIGVLNVYEILLMALALFLIRKRSLNRDGWILLAIEALFLVDLTHLNSEVFTASLRAGLLVNAACFTLALLKIAAVVHILQLKIPRAQFALIALQLAMLFSLSGVLKSLSHNGAINPTVLYAAWWIVALLPVLAAVVPQTRQPAAAFSPLPWRLYGLIPFASLLIHLCGANRVYWLHFHPANVAPVLLAGAVLLYRTRAVSRHSVAVIQMTLCALAVFVSLHTPHELTSQALGLDVTPLRAALIGAMTVSILCFIQHRRYAFASMATSCLATATLGPTVTQMRANLHAMLQYAANLLKRAVPTTAMEWGVYAVIASFLLLAIGAVISLKKSPTVESPMPPDEV